MAYNRRSPPARLPSHQPKYLLRRSPNSHRLVRIQSSPDHSLARPVLVPLHTNLRRRPSRLRPTDKLDDEPMPPPQLGAKRKRVPSANENAHAGGRSTRGSGRLKRLRSNSCELSDAGEASGMDVDAPSATRWSASASDDDDPLSELSSDEDQTETTDDYLINSASSKQLQRLRKDHLVRLYIFAGLSDEAEVLTKNEIIDSIVAARDDLADLPPSSPRGGSSDEHENDADEQVTHTPTPAARSRFTIGGLRRRATVNESNGILARPNKSRSLSMGNLLGVDDLSQVASSSKLGDSVSSPAIRRRKTSRTLATQGSFRSSYPPPTHAVSSPPATRLRSRKPSAASSTLSLSAPLSSASASASTTPTLMTNGFHFPTQRTTAAAKARGKGKGKQVEFITEVVGELSELEKEREREKARRLLAEESDLTELDDEDAAASGPGASTGPSPRRLRSKDKERERLNGTASVNGKGKENVALKMHPSFSDLQARRVTPARRAKQQQNECAAEDDEELGSDGDGDDEDEEDEDQLATPTRPRWGQKQSQRSRSPLEDVQRTPLVRRLRPRTRRSADAQLSQGEDGDGDDEQEPEEDDETVDGGEEEEEEGGEEIAEGEDEDDEEEQTIAIEPRKLRNGKIVGDDVEMEEDDEDVDEDGEEPEGVDDEAEAEGETEEDAEGEEDEAMEEEDVDLTIATAKTLVRLRRDDLVRLCETRDLEAVGTKPQLAEALLQWRDRQADASSPSSNGTVTGRPPSTAVIKRRRNNSTPLTPVLLRSERVHIDEPRTPEPKEAAVGEPELELDLESLGLEDREIPPDKLQKLEKIGSGGFKDVFIGKFRGRRIAISEFRGQLSAMDIKELKLLGGFDHPNIVRFLGVSIPENTRETPVMIVSELCSNGDLFDYVRNVPAPSLNKVLTMMLDIARGLEYLHLRKPSVIHRDCKSSNILITAKGTAKIADFGLAKVKQSTRSMVRSLVGTVNWQAPELWHAHPKYNHKVDVFSCAMVYWEMLQWHVKEKKFPWEGMNEHAIYDIVGNKKQRPSISGLKKQWCPEIVELIERMWAHQHDERPTMSEVVEALEEIKG
ncbi:kinase domain-containing protein [Favolaschia claudopus]|uniref:Kinase domain-containing protein n=1 Tax=Favolaschia claudopus TaxID=2862362 RepID=A0AAW0CIA4_9AGAR